MHRGLKHLFQVYEIDSNLEVMYDRLTMSWNFIRIRPFGVSWHGQKTINIP